MTAGKTAERWYSHMTRLILLRADLQLFAEGAGSGAGAAPGGASGGGGEGGLPVSGQQAETAGETAQDKKPIVYDSERKRRRQARMGKHPDGNAGVGKDGRGAAVQAAGATEGDDPTDGSPAAGNGAETAEGPAKEVPKDKRTLFREMVSEGGEYKAEFDEFFQEVFNARFKEYKGLQRSVETLTRQNQEHDSLFDRLAAVYGTETREDTVKAMMDDAAFWDAKADAEGLTREQYMTQLSRAEETAKVKRENDLLREAQDKRNTEERRDQLAAKRESEIAELRKEFPDFDLAAESKNPQFVSMLRIEALPLRTIYTAIHHDEILSGSVQKARADAEEAAVANIRARGMRPPENGATVTGGVSVSVGVGSLSRKERADVARRAARGELITFRS